MSCLACAGKSITPYPSYRWTIHQEHYTLSRCQECGTAFTTPLPSDQTLAHFYRSEFNYQWYRDHFLAKALDAVQRISELKPFLGQRVLDYGGGPGHFSRVARRYGYRSQSYDPYLPADQGKKLTPPWDTITCIHVLEHVTDPLAFLVRLRAWLSPGGTLVCAVPNFSSRGYQERGADWVWCKAPLHHVAHYTPEGLKLLLSRAGFKIVTTSFKERWDANPASDLDQVETTHKMEAEWWSPGWLFRKYVAGRNTTYRYRSLKKSAGTHLAPPEKRSELIVVARFG